MDKLDRFMKFLELRELRIAEKNPTFKPGRSPEGLRWSIGMPTYWLKEFLRREKDSETGQDPEQKTMNFSEALQAMKDGKSVRRHSWPKRMFVYLDDGVFYNDCELGLTKWSFTHTEDVLATDWEIKR